MKEIERRVANETEFENTENRKKNERHATVIQASCNASNSIAGPLKTEGEQQ
ncbi:hypothetical protein [Rhizobium sullae]|uniref:hypothetical protein n=1 Tax=Rhizobium sullae TaxID=50338 RepID=UPI0014048F19|nr:hypothetical protein [Rhizobium sullae]